MRPDQIQRLQDVSERLADVVIDDADPRNWSGEGKLLSDMTREERGDATWCRKTAVQSVTLLGKVHQLLGSADERDKHPEWPDPEADIKRAEKEASALLDRLGKHGATSK